MSNDMKNKWLSILKIFVVGFGLFYAQNMVAFNDGPELETIQLKLGQSRRVEIQKLPHTFYLEDPSVADYTFHAPNLVVVESKGVGKTKLYSLDQEGRSDKIVTVVVRYPVQELRMIIKEAFPEAKITLKTVADSLVVSGFVNDEAMRESVIERVREYVPKDKIIQKLEFPEIPVNAASDQVNLKVRIVEVKRKATRALGIQWDGVVQNIGKTLTGFSFHTPFEMIGSAASSTVLKPEWNFGSKVSIENIINLLEEESYATTMQEPNLTAISGQSARFRVGGSVPIVIPATDTFESGSIQYKQYGISLSYTAKVSGKYVELNVRPSVSFPQTASGAQNPSFSTKEASTTVKLLSGQSIVIAGLVSSANNASERLIPGMSNLPLVGDLFKSESIQRTEDEVIFIITPYIVHPTQHGMLQDQLDDTGMSKQGLNMTKPGFIMGWGQS